MPDEPDKTEPNPTLEPDDRPPYVKAPYDEELLGYFAYGQLPDHLREISRPFGELAFSMAEKLPGSFARTTAIRKLLEAKDAAVRAATRVGGWTVARTTVGGPGDAYVVSISTSLDAKEDQK